MSKSPVLTVVMGTFNRLTLLQQAISAVLSTVKTPIRLVVVDAGSTDGTIDYLERLRIDTENMYPVFDHERIGQAVSLNRVFRTIDTPYICWLSDDNVVRQGALETAVAILNENRMIGMVGLKVKDVGPPLAEEDSGYLGGLWPPGIINVNQGVIRSELFHKIGLFDEDFNDYGIDSDLTTRVLLSGYQVVLTRMLAVDHYREYTENSWIKTEERKGRLEAAENLYKQKNRTLLEDGIVPRRDPEKDRYVHIYKVVTRGLKFNRQRFGSRAYREYQLMRFCIEVLAKYFKITYNNRDWRNAMKAAFVSRWDLVINAFKPYYLVQRIPAHVLRAIRN